MQQPALVDSQVVIAGGSSGIGLGVARACLEAGAAVTLVGRSADRLAAARDTLGGRAAIVAADLTIEDDVRRVFADRAVDHVVVTAASLG
jgi:NADP-dependent 3-hydroxy acid dehydrogenase YdfG